MRNAGRAILALVVCLLLTVDSGAIAPAKQTLDMNVRYQGAWGSVIVVTARGPAPVHAHGRRTAGPRRRTKNGQARHGAAPPAGVVDLNRADAETLATLPGVGPGLAERIVAFRSANGPFASPSIRAVTTLTTPGISSAAGGEALSSCEAGTGEASSGEVEAAAVAAVVVSATLAEGLSGATVNGPVSGSGTAIAMGISAGATAPASI